MVCWLDPHQLVDTAARVLLAGVFSSYADNRQLQALAPAEVFDRSEGPELWLDYVADLGDGWNSTYSIASLLAADELKLDWDGEPVATERGRLLVMGGDQVYPVPKRAEYENRLLGPYRSALPCVGAGEARELFAIPGSHDWYDGLVNFTSVFCRERPIGGWQHPPAPQLLRPRPACGLVAVGRRHSVRLLPGRDPAGVLRRGCPRSPQTRRPDHRLHGQGGRERPQRRGDPLGP